MTGGNRALHTNPFVVNNRTVDIHITTRGSDWYWAVMSIMGTTMLVILGTAFLRPARNRIFYYILAAIAFVAMIEHYSMAANLGWVPIDVEFRRPSIHIVAGRNRQIWWVRYCCWFVIWPLISLVIMLSVVAPVVHTLWLVFLTAVMAVMALVGAVVRSDYKWGYYGFWVWTWLLVGYSLIWAPRRYASALGRDIQRAHLITSSWVWFLWMIYPICWGISEGGNTIPPDSEFIFYGILDCCLIPITSAAFLLFHRSIDPERLGLRMRSYDDPLPGQLHPAARAEEKMAPTNSPDPVNPPPMAVSET
ncbi:hypothetical protein DV736_g5037, partial [Chaetothyriales sp. CBS 134916]